MRRILVTGGSGFLGSHLCDRLVESGAEVVAVDNHYTGPRANLAHMLDAGKMKLVKGDVCEMDNWMFIFNTSPKFDEIYHLACPASPIHYQRAPVQTIRTCVEGTLASLDLARACGARLLLTSTSEVYGDPLIHPQHEGYWGNVNSFGPRSMYDEGKRCAEALCWSYRQEHGVDVRIARIFNTYGPRMAMDDGRVVSNFVVQALRGQELTIYGEGQQTRSFCYVDDTIDGLIKLMNSAVREPINIGNPSEHTMIELAVMIRALTRSRSPIVHRALPQDDPRRRCPDIRQAQELLGWQPRTTLLDGLTRTVAYFKETTRIHE